MNNTAVAEPSNALTRFQKTGRLLFQMGLVDSHSGNLSERIGNHILITKTGAMLAELVGQDLTTVAVAQSGWQDKKASSELIVHRAVYQAHPQLRAVLHCHAPFATLLSFEHDRLQPCDTEGKVLLGQVPIVAVEPSTASPQLATAVAKSFAITPVVVIRGHGAFIASAQHLLEALRLASALEQAARFLYYRTQKNQSFQ